ncbi:MAG: 2Fe-2S iron-sulfur cluster-binding protein [Leptospirillia bacterium]
MAKVTFLPSGVTIEADPSDYPYGHDGDPGSLLDIGLAGGVDIGHNCGGVCACTTCHVVVKSGAENLSEMDDDEEDRLDTAKGLTLHSRLACKAVVEGTGEVTVEVMMNSEQAGGH